MKAFTTEAFNASDPAVQRAGHEELKKAYETLKWSVSLLDPGPPTNDQGGVAAWCSKAKMVFDESLNARSLVEDAEKRREKKRNSTFVICIPTFGLVSVNFMNHMMSLGHPMSSGASVVTPIAMEIGVARNACVERALASKPRPDYILFVDDDVLLPWDALVRLHEHNLPIVGGMYHLKQIPSYPLLWRNNDRGGYLRPGVDYKIGDLVEVDGTGCGCVLFKTEVFEKITPPYFKTGPTLTPDGTEFHTEDAWAYRKLQQAGYKIYVDTAVNCGHEDRETGRIF